MRTLLPAAALLCLAPAAHAGDADTRARAALAVAAARRPPQAPPPPQAPALKPPPAKRAKATAGCPDCGCPCAGAGGCTCDECRCEPACPGRQREYDGSYAWALRTGQPLVVWVGQKVRHDPYPVWQDAPSPRPDSYFYTTGKWVCVGQQPYRGADWIAEYKRLDGTPTKDELYRAVMSLPHPLPTKEQWEAAHAGHKGRSSEEGDRRGGSAYTQSQASAPAPALEPVTQDWDPHAAPAPVYYYTTPTAFVPPPAPYYQTGAPAFRPALFGGGGGGGFPRFFGGGRGGCGPSG